MTRRLLITGGAGFIGANFTRSWCDSHPGDRVVVLDALTYAGNLASVASLREQGRIRFERGDIRDFDLVCNLLSSEQLDTIVHFAAESHVDRSIHGPAQFIATNVTGTQTLLDAARKVWLKAGPSRHRFHHISTDEVYGSLAPADPPFRETTPYDPRSPYAASKAASDHIVRAYGHTYGIDYCISNCSNNYGPYQFPEKLIPLCIVNLLEGRPLPIYGDGSNVRDWLHVDDHCRAVTLMLERAPAATTWNVGGECERTNLQLVHALCGAVDAAFARDKSLAERFPACPAARGEPSAASITFVKDRPGHDRRYAIDAGRLREHLEFRPRIELEAGLQQTVAWYLDNEPWWRAILSGSYQDWVDLQYARAP